MTRSLWEPCFTIHSENSNDFCSPASPLLANMLSRTKRAVPPPGPPNRGQSSNLYLGGVIAMQCAVSFAVSQVSVIDPCHTAAILSWETKRALFYHAKPRNGNDGDEA